MLFLRARQRPITKGTVMPGESKELRPPKVVLRRGTSLILNPQTRPHLRTEPQALPLTMNPAKRVREPKIPLGVKTKTVFC